MLARAAAALELVRHHELDGELALSYVAAPTVELEEASEQTRPQHGRGHGFPEETRARAVALVNSGASWQEAAEQVGAAKASVGQWVRDARP